MRWIGTDGRILEVGLENLFKNSLLNYKSPHAGKGRKFAKEKPQKENDRPFACMQTPAYKINERWSTLSFRLGIFVDVRLLKKKRWLKNLQSLLGTVEPFTCANSNVRGRAQLGDTVCSSYGRTEATRRTSRQR